MIELRKFGKNNQTFSAKDGKTAKQRAEDEALRIAVELNAGGVAIESLTPGERVAFARAQALAKRRGLDLTAAVTEWDTARARLASELPGVDLSTAIAAGIKALSQPTRLLFDVCTEFLASKNITSGAGDYDQRWARDFRVILGALCTAFQRNINAITTPELEKWLAGRKRKDGHALGPKRRNYVLSMVVALFRFARNRGYLPDTQTAAQMIERDELPKTTIKVFTPREMQTLLSHIEEPWLPWPVLVGFNGVRTEEVCLGKNAGARKDCLRWEDFDWANNELCIRAEVSKTGFPRRIELHNNTVAWLAPWRDAGATGPVTPQGDIRGKLDKYRLKLRAKILHEKAEKFDEITEAILQPWNNALRHSYGSYLAAECRDLQRVAYQMGDSPSMVKRHYNNPRPRTQAQAWFAIWPGENVHQLILFRRVEK